LKILASKTQVMVDNFKLPMKSLEIINDLIGQEIYLKFPKKRLIEFFCLFF